jgi:hypothetical protein
MVARVSIVHNALPQTKLTLLLSAIVAYDFKGLHPLFIGRRAIGDDVVSARLTAAHPPRNRTHNSLLMTASYLIIYGLLGKGRPGGNVSGKR